MILMIPVMSLLVLLLIPCLIAGFLYYSSKKGFNKTANVPGKFQRLTCVLLGLTAFGIVIGFSLNEILSQAGYSSESEMMSYPTMDVPKLEGKSEKFRALVQLFAVQRSTDRLLAYEEKILTDKQRTMPFNKKIGNIYAEGKITIDGFYKDYIDCGYELNTRNSRRTYVGHSSGGLSEAGSYTADRRNARPFRDTQLMNHRNIFSYSGNNRDRIDYYAIVSRIQEKDPLRKVNYAHIMPNLDKDQSYDYRGKANHPFEFLLSSPLALLTLLTGSFLLARASGRNYSFALFSALAVFIVIGLKNYEFSLHEGVAVNKELSFEKRISAARYCSHSELYGRKGQKILEELLDKTDISKF